MPSYFKALATIMVGILWISSLVMGFGTLIIGTIAGDLFDPGQLLPMSYPATFVVAGFYAILALLAMKIWKGLE